MLNKILHFLAKVYWFIFRPKTLGVKVVVYRGQEIAMIKNSYGGWNKWMFPGGGVKRGENLNEAAVREVREELGLSLINLKRIGEYNSNKEYKKDTAVVFMGESQKSDFKIDSKEISEAAWFNLGSLPDISEYSKKIIEMFYAART